MLPKAIRDELEWPAGAHLTVERRDDSVVLRRKTTLRPKTVAEVAGMLKYDGPPVSIEDMQRGIDEALRERWARKSR